MKELNNKKFSFISKNVYCNIDLSRFENQFKKAQEVHDKNVLYDTEPYVRFYTGYLNEQSKKNNIIGSGRIIYEAYDRNNFSYAYETYTNTHNKVTKTGHPNATPLWFEYSKNINKTKWIDEVKKVAGGK